MPERNSKKKVLIFFVGLLGDSLMALPTIRMLSQLMGESVAITILHEVREKISWSARDIFAEQKVASNFIQYKYSPGGIKNKLIEYVQLIYKLRKYRYDYVIYMAPITRKKRTVVRDHIFFKLAKCDKLIGFYGIDSEELKPTKPFRSASDIYCSRVAFDMPEIKCDINDEHIKFNVELQEQMFVQKWLERNKINGNKELVAIAPGAKQQSKYWDLNKFELLGKKLLETGKVSLVVIGGKAEECVGDKLIRKWKTGANAAGKFKINETAALLKKCKILIGLDTGTTHLAAFCGTQCVVLFGGRDVSGLWEPLGGNHIIIKGEAPCSGCMLEICEKGDNRCMSSIDVERVWKQVEKLL